VAGSTTQVRDQSGSHEVMRHRFGHADHACSPGGWKKVGDIWMKRRPLVHLDRLEPARFERSHSALRRRLAFQVHSLGIEAQNKAGLHARRIFDGSTAHLFWYVQA